MQIGVTLPNHRGINDVDAVFAIGSLAEEMQFDSVWASDHLLNDSHIEKRIGQRPYYSPLACLTYLAGVTKSIRLGTSVLTLPLYPLSNWPSTSRRWTSYHTRGASSVWGQVRLRRSTRQSASISQTGVDCSTSHSR